jgi:microcystin-dependent protein
MTTKFVNTIKLPVSTAAVVEAGSWPQASIYYDTTSSSIRWYNGSAWADLNAGSGTVNMPTASIQPWTGSSIPSGWLLCNGQSVNTYTYRTLHAIISNRFGGTAYSAGVTDQSGAVTAFNVPDLRGYQIVGANLSTGSIDNTSTYRVGSNSAETITAHSSEVHSHSITYATYSELDHTQSHSHSASPVSATGGAHTHTGTSVTSNGGQSHTHTPSNGNGGSVASTATGTLRATAAHTHAVPTVSTNTHSHTVTVGTLASTGGHTHTVNLSLTTPSAGLTSASPASHGHTTTVANSASHQHTTHSYKTIMMHYIVKV